MVVVLCYYTYHRAVVPHHYTGRWVVASYYLSYYYTGRWVGIHSWPELVEYNSSPYYMSVSSIYSTISYLDQ